MMAADISRIVLDASIAIAWCFEDEKTALTEAVLDLLVRCPDLANDEQFISATVQATQAAVRTHRREKLDALRNAVLNVALKKEKSDDRQAEFLALVGHFTPLHLEILSFCRSPQLPEPPASSRAIPDYKRPTLYKILFGRFKDLRSEVGSKIDGRDAASVQFVTLVVREL